MSRKRKVLLLALLHGLRHRAFWRALIKRRGKK